MLLCVVWARLRVCKVVKDQLQPPVKRPGGWSMHACEETISHALVLVLSCVIRIADVHANLEVGVQTSPSALSQACCAVLPGICLFGGHRRQSTAIEKERQLSHGFTPLQIKTTAINMLNNTSLIVSEEKKKDNVWNVPLTD